MRWWAKYKIWCLQLFVYFILFLWFYYPFIEQNMLPGRIDSWFNLGIFKHYSNLIDNFVTNAPIFLSNYPEGKVFLYGESSLLAGFLFSIIDLFSSNDLKAYIGLYIVIQTLNSISFAIFIKSFLKTDYVLAFVGGLFFSFTAFNLAFFDNIVYSVWFPVFFSLYFILKAFDSDTKGRYFLLASLFIYAQIYFSIYNFFMGAILIGVLTITCYNRRFADLKQAAKHFILLSPLAFPFVYLYIINSQIPSDFNDYLTIDVIDSLGFQLSDLYRSFKTNLLYGRLTEFDNSINDYWHIGNVGIATIALAIVGFFNVKKRYKIFLGVCLTIGLILSFGPFWGSLKSPSYLLYKLLPALKQFKLIFKFYYLVQISVIILSINGILYLSSLIPSKKAWLYLVFSIIFLIENLPKDVLEYSVDFYRPSIAQETLSELQEQKNCTLFLPFCAPMFPEELNKACFVEGRNIEFKYLYWQAFLEINMLNGSNGTIPKNRLLVNEVLDNMAFNEAVASLASSHDLKYIFYDKKVKYTFKNPSLTTLKNQFTIFTETEDYLIFKVK